VVAVNMDNLPMIVLMTSTV